MLNTYNRFRPRPPDAASLGTRLLGSRRGVQQKLNVARPPVQTFFNNALAARGMVTQPAPYALATSNNHGLAGFGRFGALGAFGEAGNTIFGPFAFAEEWSLSDFLGANPQWLSEIDRQVGFDSQMGPAGSWEPPPQSLVAAAAQKWAAIDEARYFDPRTETFAANIDATMKAAIQQADAGTRRNVIVATNRRWAIYEKQRIEAFKRIKGALAQVAQFVVPPTAPSTPPTNTRTTPGGGGGIVVPPFSRTPAGTVSNPVTGGGGGGGTGGGGGGGGGGGSTAQAPASNTGLYVGVGVAVLAVGGIAWYLLKKK